MILACASCGKKFKYNGAPANRPTSCPKCKGPLADAEEAPAALPRIAAAAEDGRLKELETRLAEVEAELKEAEATNESLQRELEEAHASISRIGVDLEKSQAAYKEALRHKDEEARQHETAREEAQASIARLGHDLEKAQAAYREALAKKEREIEELQSRARGAATGPAEQLEAQLNAARAEADEKAQELEKAQARIAELEQGGGGGGGGEGGDIATLRSEMGRKLIEKDKALAEAEEKIQALQEDLDLERAKLRGKIGTDEAATLALAEKEKRLAEAERELAVERARAQELDKRVRNLEQIRKAEHASYETRVRQKDDVKARVNEARYLAEDLDRNLESLVSSLSGVRERIKRLHSSLHSPEPELPPLPVPPPPAAEEPPAAEVSEAAPEVRVEADPEPAPPAAYEEDPFAKVEPAPAGDALPADETLLDMGRMGKQVREAAAAAEEAPAELPPAAEAPADEIQVTETEEAPAAEEAPAPPPEEPRRGTRKHAPPPPKKRGFFGKLFGKK